MSRILVLMAILAGAVAGRAEGFERLPAILHLHSDLSTGDFPVERLAAIAERKPDIREALVSAAAEASL